MRYAEAVKWWRPARTSVGLGLFLIPLVVAGCGRRLPSESLVGFDASGRDGGAATSLEAAPPTMDELRNRLALDSDQEPVVSRALARWQSAVQPRGGAGIPGAPGGRPGGRGPGGPGGGPPREMPCGQAQPPQMTFVEETAEVLRSSQLIAEARFLAERERAHVRPGGDAHRGRGPGPIGPILMRLGREFQLDQATMRQLGDAFRESHVSMMRLRHEHNDGAITAETARDSAALARDQLAATADAVLADHAFARLKALIAEVRTRSADCALGQLSESMARMTQATARILGLSDDQKLLVENTLTGFLPRWMALLNGIKDGSIPFEAAFFDAVGIEHDTHQAIRALLTVEQAARWDALRLMGPGRGPAIIYF